MDAYLWMEVTMDIHGDMPRCMRVMHVSVPRHTFLLVLSWLPGAQPDPDFQPTAQPESWAKNLHEV